MLCVTLRDDWKKPASMGGEENRQKAEKAKERQEAARRKKAEEEVKQVRQSADWEKNQDSDPLGLYSQRLQTSKDSLVRSDFRRWRCGCALYRRVALGRQAVSVRHWASPSRVAGSWIVAIIILAIGRRADLTTLPGLELLAVEKYRRLKPRLGPPQKQSSPWLTISPA
jgi:hypothetical protein